MTLTNPANQIGFFKSRLVLSWSSMASRAFALPLDILYSIVIYLILLSHMRVHEYLVYIHVYYVWEDWAAITIRTAFGNF